MFLFSRCGIWFFVLIVIQLDHNVIRMFRDLDQDCGWGRTPSFQYQVLSSRAGDCVPH